MNPTIKPNQQITVHKDRTVSYFSIYLQQWDRIDARALMRNRDLNALTPEDREMIKAAAARLEPA